MRAEGGEGRGRGRERGGGRNGKRQDSLEHCNAVSLVCFLCKILSFFVMCACPFFVLRRALVVLLLLPAFGWSSFPPLLSPRVSRQKLKPIPSLALPNKDSPSLLNPALTDMTKRFQLENTRQWSRAPKE